MQWFIYMQSLSWETNLYIEENLVFVLLLSSLCISLPTVSVVFLMAHCLYFASKTQLLKQVMSPFVFLLQLSLIAAGLRLPLWRFNLVIFCRGYCLFHLYWIFFSTLRSKWFVDWVGREAKTGSFCRSFVCCYHLQCPEVFPSDTYFRILWNLRYYSLYKSSASF